MSKREEACRKKPKIARLLTRKRTQSIVDTTTKRHLVYANYSLGESTPWEEITRELVKTVQGTANITVY